jgi:hypothetical protein
MKHRMKYVITACLLLFAVGMQAQEGLSIGNVFHQYAKRHGSTMVQLSADVLKMYDMTLYKSLSFKPASGSYGLQWVSACIDQDKRKAKKIKETLLDGQLQSGYYQLPQVQRGINRFILFKATSNWKKATLIYIEGTLSSAELVEMLFNKK